MRAETKWFMITMFVVLIILITGTIIFVKTQVHAEFPQSQSPGEGCNVLAYSSPDAIDIVYLASKEDAEQYSKFFLETNPHSLMKNNFNLYYIDTKQEELICEEYKGIALFCYSKENMKKASVCPNDYVIAILKAGRDLRSSAYLNFVSINSNHQMSVQTHELGHAIAALAEEYINNQNPKGPNCVDEQAKFNGLEEGFFQGCSVNDLYRSIANGVMRTLNSNEYGKFNEAVIIKELEETKSSKSPITGFAAKEENFCSDELYYLIELAGKEGGFELISRSLEHGCASDAGAGEDTYTIFSRDMKQTQQGDLNLQIYTDIQLENSEILTGEIFSPDKIILAIPKRPNDYFLIISADKEEVANINLFDIGVRTCNT